MEKKKAILIILDGWGIGDRSKSDIIYQGETVFIDSLYNTYPHAQLLTCGEDVGLPDGQMGNSEVGHLNIGAGRVVSQDLVRINKAIEQDTISDEKVLVDAYKYAKENNKNVHLIGLLSDGGVHSSDKHLYKLCDIAKDNGLEDVFIHAIMDGRDTDPMSGLGYLQNLQDHLENSSGKIASVCGRYYTMDRDKRWERIKVGYDLLVNGTGTPSSNVVDSVKLSYEESITDEFIKPIITIDEHNSPIATIKEGDVVICFNFRTDRLREITTVLTQTDKPEYDMHTLDLYYVTMTKYDDTFKNIKIIYEKDNVRNTIGEYLSKSGRKQLRIAETEKYAHVTFFFSGGHEEEFPGERRILIPSPKVATYDLQPEMSAFLVKDAVIAELNKQDLDFICLNFANGDMVGHTGVYESILKAVKTVDECLKELVEAVIRNGYSALIIADHGNADYAVNPDGSPNTAHSLNPVPMILISDEYDNINSGILADVAPTLLTIMGMEIPNEMTGKSLV